MPFRHLGLAPDADELAVRRAYARLLKQNRPDDDPVAFQRLNEAYQACLAQVRRRQWETVEAEEGAEDQDDAPSPVAQDLAGHARATPEGSDDPDAAEQAGQREPADEPEEFDLSAFLDRLFAQIDRAPADQVLAWLQAEPALYSIGLKSAITVEVVSAVTDREPLPPLDTLDVIADFFAIQSLGPRDWWLVEQVDACRTIARTRAQVQAGELPRSPGSAPPRYFEQLIDRELMRQGLGPRSLALMLLPGMPSRVHARVLELDQLTEGASAPLVNPGLSSLSARLADRQRTNLARLALTWIRTVVYTALALGLLYASNGTLAFEIIEAGLVLGVVFTGWQLGVSVYSWLRGGIERRGHGHLVREGSAVLLVLAALSLDLLAPGVPRSIVYILAVVGLSRVVTVARLQTGYVVGLLLGAADLLLNTLDLFDSPFSPMLLGLAGATAIVIGVDRLQAMRQDLPIEHVVYGESWMSQGRVVAIVGALAATAVLVGWLLR
ncbi:J domain-containing protein [Arenimonas sp. MALMAid1274]|uniref:J domain-containing protein n=1 Tax=Arenimonas sp. MALMAid1274 TaxID=3411630 RepID=UPI003B9EC9C1